MAEYIDREALIAELTYYYDHLKSLWESMDDGATKQCCLAEMCGVSESHRRVKAITTADVVEVRHGYWTDKPTGAYSRMQSWCSVCGKHSGIGGIESNRHKPYCPNCGAKMDGKGEGL